MANDTQRDKARATFGKTFFENSKAQPQPKNSMSALQARANARPIPTFKVGGVVKKADGGKAGKDFTGLMTQAAARAAKKGMPVMKAGGPTKEHMAKRIESRMEAGAYKKGGEAKAKKLAVGGTTAVARPQLDRARIEGMMRGMMPGGPRMSTTNNGVSRVVNPKLPVGTNMKKGGKVMCKADGGEAQSRYDRKMKDIEKDYKIALAKGKNEGVAKAKYEQRVADAKDDLAKWTKSDRSATSAAEKAAEAALTEARKTKGQSIMQRDAAKSFAQNLESKADMPKKMATTEMVSGIGAAPSLPAAKTEKKVAMPERRQVPVRRQVPAATVQRQAPANAPATNAPAATAQRQAPAVTVQRQAPAAAAQRQAPAAAAPQVQSPGAAAGSAYGYARIAREQAAQKRAAEQKAADEAAAKEAAARRAKNDELRRRMLEAPLLKTAVNRPGYKEGGKPGKYAAGGAGKVRKGMMKGR